MGQLMAMSLVQEGSGFSFMAPPMYKYLCGIEMASIDVTVKDVPNEEVKALIEEVRVQEYLSRTILQLPGTPSVNEDVFIPVMRFITIYPLLTRLTMPQMSKV